MKLDDILNAEKARASHPHDHGSLYLHGSLEPDHDQSFFRLYREPSNRRSYLLIKKSDVTEDIYQWTVEETCRAGFIGVKLYRGIADAARLGGALRRGYD